MRLESTSRPTAPQLVAALLRPFEHMARSRVNYWLGYALDAIACVAFLVAGFAEARVVPALASALAGLAGWTLWEYGFHRWLFHRDGSPLSLSHHAHHAAPRERNGLPFFVALLVAFALLACGRLLLPGPYALVFVGGVYLGYVHYSVLHHVQHATAAAFGPYRRLRRHHMTHHRLVQANFGVTTSFWDRVFGSYRAS